MKNVKDSNPKSFNRKKLDKRVRLASLAILTVLLVVSISIWASSYTLSANKVEKATTYNYEQKGKIDFIVHLLPNSLYDTPTLGPGNTYFEKLVDYIGVVFSYQFSGTDPAEINGVYEIDATIKTKTWEKKYILSPSKNFSSNESSATFTAELPLYLANYEDFVATIEKETGVSAQETQLVITCNISTIAKPNSGDAQASLTPNMVIPLRQGSFEISGDLTKETNDSLVKYVQVHQSSVDSRKTYSLIPVPILGVLLLVVLFFTQSKPVIMTESIKANLFRKEIAKTEKKYQDSIVTVSSVAPTPNERVVKVNSLAELIKLTDELGKPMLHLTEGDKNIYCVIDGATRYQYMN